MLDFMVFDDIIRAGDINRVPVILKHLAPTFIGLNSLHSKYAIECINMITKLEWVLSDQQKPKCCSEHLSMHLAKKDATSLLTCSKKTPLK
jgi:hypothetical protein